MYNFIARSAILVAIFKFLFCFSAEFCNNQPECWSKDLICSKPSRRCNGDLCITQCTKGIQIDKNVKEILEIQRKIQREMIPLNRAFYLGTHNSFISAHYGIGIEEIELTNRLKKGGFSDPRNHRVVIANQRISITAQLNIGVRHLELDLHDQLYLGAIHGDDLEIGSLNDTALDIMVNFQKEDSKNQFKESSDIYLCHWDLAPPVKPLVRLAELRAGLPFAKWESRRIGCWSGNLKLVDGLFEIKSWLENNPQEFVVLYLDNRVKSFWKLMGVMEKVFSMEEVLTPLTVEKQFSGKMPTTQEAVDAGYKVMFEYQDKYDWRQSYAMARDSLFERGGYWWEFGYNQFHQYPTCQVGSSPMLKSKMNYGLSTQKTFSNPFVNGFMRRRALDDSLSLPLPFFGDKSQEKGISTARLKKLVRCGVDILSFDQLTPNLLQDSIWSFELGEQKPPKVAKDEWHLVIKSSNGRWVKSANIHQEQNFKVCRDSGNPLNQLKLAKNCSDGMFFDLPRTPRENTYVTMLMDGKKIPFAILNKKPIEKV